MSKNQVKSASLETIAGRMYRAAKSDNAALWELAEYIAVETANKVPQKEIADRVQSTLTNRAPDGAPIIRISQGRISQLLNGYKAYGAEPGAIRYNPATLYQYLGKNGDLSEYETIAAERAQKRSKRAMTDGGKGGKPGKGKGKDTAEDAELAELNKRMHKLARAMGITTTELLRDMLVVAERAWDDTK